MLPVWTSDGCAATLPAVRRSSLLLYITPLLALAACATAPEPRTDDGRAPHGIVLVVGDGMGAAHFTLARLLRGEDCRIAELTHVGLVATDATDTLVTDSAAAATAFATGVKTKKGYVGADPSGGELRTVVEIAEERGLATGLITTTVFVDATPAAFAAHVADRAELGVIARQMTARGVDILAGNGLELFGRNGWPSVEELAGGRYRAARTAAELHAATEGPVLAILPSAPLDGQSPEMPLAELAAWSLERLSRNPGGFFLLLEHEGTDTASHRNVSEALEASVLEVDDTVGVALDFARERGGILVVVVGDHETGGLQIAGEPGAPELVWRDDYHSGEAVPIFAEGPGAAAFGGFIDNTDVGKALLALVGRMGE